MAMTDSPGPVDDPAPLLSPVSESIADASLSTDELGSRIVALSGRLAAATCRFLLLVAEFDARDGFCRFGMASTAAWLQYACGTAHRTAVEHVRVARSLAAHPALASEMRAGRLSYSQVRAISRVADLGDDTMLTDLINLARNGTVGQLEDTVRGLRTVEDQNDELAGRREQYVRRGWTGESQYRISARLDPEAGALLDSALDAVAAGAGLTQAEALVRLAEIGLAAVRDARARELRQDELAAVVVHLDVDRLPADAPDDTGGARSAERARRPVARIDHGPGLSDAVVRRMLCAGRVRTAVRDGTKVLDLGRSRRLVSTKQFRALVLRDGGCAAPGCRRRRHLHAHHVRHWIDGGPTDLANLILLCGAHHRALHDGAFRIVAHGDETFSFRLADGRDWPQHLDPARLIGTARWVEQEHDVVADAATTRWDGSRLDRDLAVWGIAQHLRRTRPAA
jgi:hypothetical protein